MMTPDDQPRPDLDSAIDAVIPSLAAVSDEAVADSLRRTRIALLAHVETRRAPAWGWGVAVASLAAVVLLTTVSLWFRSAPAPASGALVARKPPVPAGVPSAAAPPASTALAPTGASPRDIAPKRIARVPRVEAIPAPAVEETPSLDPLVALARAVQEIPEDAWREAAQAGGPITIADLSVTPNRVSPLVTPQIADEPSPPPVQGEP